MLKQKNRINEASHGHLCLVFLKINDVLSLVEGLSPEATISFLAYYLQIYERSIKESGGQIASAEGNCVLAAWPDDSNKKGKDYIEKFSFLLELRSKLQAWLSRYGERHVAIVAAICRGECTFETSKGGYIQIYGSVVSRAYQLAEQCDKTETAIIFDATIRDDSLGYDVQSVSEGTFKMKWKGDEKWGGGAAAR